MDPQVQIILSAIDNASAVLGKASGGGIIGSFTELSSAIGLAKQAVAAIGQAYDATIGETLAYDLQIRKLAQNLGLSTEETGRLVTISDEAGVSIDSVTTALQMMVRRGTAPSIEELAKIADQYNAIKDPVQQAALMVELLGRNWTALTPMLRQGGDAIRANAAAVADGLAPTKQMTDNADRMRESTVKLNESLTVLKNNLGNQVIPELADFMQFLVRATDAYQVADGNAIKFWITLGKSRIEQEKAQKAVGDHTAALQAQGLAYTANQRALEALDLAGLGADHTQQNLNTTTDAGVLADKAAALAAQELAGKQGELASAEDNLRNAQHNLNQSMGSEAQSAAEKAGQSFGRTQEALKIQDAVFDTNSAAVAQRGKDIADATKTFMNSPQTEADKTAYLTRLQEIRDAYTPLDDSIDLAKQKVQELQAEIDKLHGKNITVTVNQVAGGGSFNPDVTHNPGGGGGPPTVMPPDIGPVIGGTQNAQAAPFVSGGTVFNQTFNISGGGDAKVIGSAAKTGVLAALRAKGMA